MSTPSTSINQLPVVSDITDADFLIIDNEIETRRLNFKDFIIGLDNVTFASTISGNSSDIQSLSTTVVTNTNNISALSATALTNAASISALSATALTNAASISALSANVITLSATALTNTTSVSGISAVLYQAPTARVMNQSTHFLRIVIQGTAYAMMLSATA